MRTVTAFDLSNGTRAEYDIDISRVASLCATLRRRGMIIESVITSPDYPYAF